MSIVIHANNVTINGAGTKQKSFIETLDGLIQVDYEPRFTLSAGGLIVTDHKTGLMWPVYESEEEHNFDASERYAANLALAGFREWFNPSRKQRESIVDLTRHKPALYVPLQSRSNSWEWTSTGCAWTVEAGAPRAFWQVYGYYGNASYDHRASKAFSRPCRFVARPGQ